MSGINFARLKRLVLLSLLCVGLIGRNQNNADQYLVYLTTDDAQNIYAKYGFIKANAQELKSAPL